MQFRVNCPRKRFRIMGNHTDLRRAETRGNMRMRDDVARQKLRVEG